MKALTISHAYLCNNYIIVLASERSERASISSVQWKSAIYIFIRMYVRTFTHASTNNLDSVTNWTFHAGWSSLTNTMDSSIAHTPWKKRKQIKANVGTGERSKTE